MDSLSSTPGIVALAAAALALLALIVAAVALRMLRRVRADQRAVLGEGGQDVVAHQAELQHRFEALAQHVDAIAERLDARLTTAEQRIDHAFTYRAMLRYDAYNEMSGRQSMTIALLDEERSGIVLSSIHHRDQARVYAKELVAGASELQLSPEEEEAVRLAMAPGPPGA